jgi:hypothetical protein
MPEELKIDLLKLYEDGKHRRYELLFAVNGGAFAIAKFFGECKDNPSMTLGSLSLRELALGMVLFTIVMVGDIAAFGYKMRGKLGNTVFAVPGMLVLFSIGVLICLGWMRVRG